MMAPAASSAAVTQIRLIIATSHGASEVGGAPAARERLWSARRLRTGRSRALADLRSGHARAPAILRVLRPRPASGVARRPDLHVRVHVLRGVRRGPARGRVPELRRRLRAAPAPPAGEAGQGPRLDGPRVRAGGLRTGLNGRLGRDAPGMLSGTVAAARGASFAGGVSVPGHDAIAAAFLGAMAFVVCALPGRAGRRQPRRWPHCSPRAPSSGPTTAPVRRDRAPGPPVRSAELAAGAVRAPAIGAGAVGASKLAAGAVCAACRGGLGRPPLRAARDPSPRHQGHSRKHLRAGLQFHRRRCVDPAPGELPLPRDRVLVTHGRLSAGRPGRSGLVTVPESAAGFLGAIALRLVVRPHGAPLIAGLRLAVAALCSPRAPSFSRGQPRRPCPLPRAAAGASRPTPFYASSRLVLALARSGSPRGAGLRADHRPAGLLLLATSAPIPAPGPLRPPDPELSGR